MGQIKSDNVNQMITITDDFYLLISSNCNLKIWIKKSTDKSIYQFSSVTFTEHKQLNLSTTTTLGTQKRCRHLLYDTKLQKSS